MLNMTHLYLAQLLHHFVRPLSVIGRQCVRQQVLHDRNKLAHHVTKKHVANHKYCGRRVADAWVVTTAILETYVGGIVRLGQQDVEQRGCDDSARNECCTVVLLNRLGGQIADRRFRDKFTNNLGTTKDRVHIVNVKRALLTSS